MLLPVRVCVQLGDGLTDRPGFTLLFAQRVP